MVIDIINADWKNDQDIGNSTVPCWSAVRAYRLFVEMLVREDQSMPIVPDTFIFHEIKQGCA
jgi:hypothetical protein